MQFINIFIKKGVLYDPICSSAKLNHAVLLVGYGDDYYIVKNSWGLDWGMKGYIYMSKDKDNNCGIASCALYVI